LASLGTSWSVAFAENTELVKYGVVTKGGGLIFSIIILGYAFMHLAIAIMSFVSTAYKGHLKFNLGWWALTFPMGVFFMGCLGVADLTNSDGFRVVAEVIGAFVLLFWVCVFSMTIFCVFTGELFHSASLATLNDMGEENPDSHDSAPPKEQNRNTMFRITTKSEA